METLCALLKDYKTNNLWEGSGSYYVGVIFNKEWEWDYPRTFVTKSKKSFNSERTTLSFTDFEEVITDVAVIEAKLELSGQVVYEYFNEANNTFTYPEYSGSLTLNDNNGGTATITGGKLSYTIGTPKNLVTWELFGYSFRGYDVTVSDKNVQGFILELDKEDASRYYHLSKEKIVYNVGNTSGMTTLEDVMYVYVDRDVTVSGKEDTSISKKEGVNCTYTYITKNFSLALKKGWNAVYTKTESSSIYPAGEPNNASSVTSTVTVSLNVPTLNWVLDERDTGGNSNGGPQDPGKNPGPNDPGEKGPSKE